MKVLAAYGCSHSGTGYGDSWNKILAERMGMKHYRRSAPGSNLGQHLDKLNYDLQNEQIDLVVLQLSQFFRLTLGMSELEDMDHEYRPTEDGFRFGNTGAFTYAGAEDDEVFDQCFGLKLSDEYKGIQKFFARYILPTTWMRRFCNQQLYTFISLCKQYNKPLYIFSWYEPIKARYVMPEWHHMLEGVGFWEQSTDGYEGWFHENKIPCVPNDGHYSTSAHQRLVDEVLYDKVNTFYNGSDV
jgi:hypothetical protein